MSFRNKLKKFLIIFIFGGFIFSEFSSAQERIEFIKSGDEENFYEFSSNNLQVLFSGGLQFYYTREIGKLFGAAKSENFGLKFNIDLESIIFADTSLFVRLASPNNAMYADPLYKYNYYSFVEKDQDSVSNNDTGIVVDQAYLEYRYNPLVKLRFGQQPLLLGDKEGIIYNGGALGVTQSCTLGTWCYYIGLAYFGNSSNNWTSFFHISYPLYDQEKTITDFWGKEFNFNRFNAEAYVVFYGMEKIALANYGGTTRNPNYNLGLDNRYSQFQASRNPTSLEYIFRKANWKYLGLNLDWQMYPFEATAKGILFSGSSKYSAEDSVNRTTSDIKTVNHESLAFQVASSFQILQSHKLSARAFYSQSNKFDKDATSGVAVYDLKRDRNFYEINKGTYGDANIYFGGLHASGQAHSISNLFFLQTGYSYKASLDSIGYDLRLYWFNRSNPVFNQDGKQVRNIGYEIDNDISLYLTQNLEFVISASFLYAEAAFSPNDNTLPISKPVSVLQLDLRVNYKF